MCISLVLLQVTAEKFKHDGSIEPSTEPYFGANIENLNPHIPKHILVESQRLCQRLHESRFGSMQRFVSFLVLFHRMGKDVEVRKTTSLYSFTI